MVTKRDDDDRRPTTDRVNIEQSASGRWTGRVLQYLLPLMSFHSWDNFATIFLFNSTICNC